MPTGRQDFRAPGNRPRSHFTIVEHARKFGAKCLELRDALIDGSQMARRDFVGIFARLFWLCRQSQEFANIADVETQIAAMLDKIQSRDVGRAVSPLPALGAKRCSQQADLLVVADRRHLHAALPRQFSDRNVHFSLEPLVTRDCMLFTE